MSFQAMAWAVGLRLPTREKFLLLMLSNYASNERGDCYPSLNRLADDTGMARNTVIEGLRSLESMGAMQVLRREQDGVRLPNVYRLNLAWQGGSAPVAPLGRQTDGGSAPVAPEPVSEPITKEKEHARTRIEKPKRPKVTTNEAGQFVVPDEVMATYRAAYAHIDIEAEAAAAAAWCRSNLTRAPRSDHGRFLNAWLMRAERDARSKPRLATVGGAAVGRKAGGDRLMAHLFDQPAKEAPNVVDVVATEVKQ